MTAKQLAYDFAQSLTEHDLDRFARLLHPAYINHNAFAAPGRAGSVAVFAGFLHAFPDFQVSIEDVFEDGATVIGRFI